MRSLSTWPSKIMRCDAIYKGLQGGRGQLVASGYASRSKAGHRAAFKRSWVTLGVIDGLSLAAPSTVASAVVGPVERSLAATG